MTWPSIHPCTILMVGLFTSIAAATSHAAPSPKELPATPGLILIGAQWCAPCKAELANLPALVAAASPERVALGWVDRPPALPAALVNTVDILPVTEARSFASRHMVDARGLPFALRIVRSGAVCMVWRGPLQASDIANIRRRCPDD